MVETSLPDGWKRKAGVNIVHFDHFFGKGGGGQSGGFLRDASKVVCFTPF